jgi:hypothetical protein
MATVNLGSIKFNWQGAYNGATAYSVDDVVSYNGASYICTAASTGNLPTDTNFWDQMSQAGTDGTDLGTTLTTQGDILYRNASGLARLGAGTSGQVLQSGGTGANVSWTNVSSDYVKINSFTPSSVATVDIDNIFSTSDGYNSYKIVLDRFTPATDAVQLEARFIENNGTVIGSAAYHWMVSGGEVTSAGGNFGQNNYGFNNTQLSLSGAGGSIDNDTTNGGCYVTLEFVSPSESAYTMYQGRTVYIRGPNLDNFLNSINAGMLATTNGVRGIRFNFASGNIASGTVTVYGRK